MFNVLKTQKPNSIETFIGKYNMSEYSFVGPNGGKPKHQSCKHFDMQQKSEEILCVALIFTE